MRSILCSLFFLIAVSGYSQSTHYNEETILINFTPEHSKSNRRVPTSTTSQPASTYSQYSTEVYIPPYIPPPPHVSAPRVKDEPKDIVNDFWGEKKMSPPGNTQPNKNFWGESNGGATSLNRNNGYSNSSESTTRNPSVSDRVETSLTPGNERRHENSTTNPRSVGATNESSNPAYYNHNTPTNISNSSPYGRYEAPQRPIGEQKSTPSQGVSTQFQKRNNP